MKEQQGVEIISEIKTIFSEKSHILKEAVK